MSTWWFVAVGLLVTGLVAIAVIVNRTSTAIGELRRETDAVRDLRRHAAVLRSTAIEVSAAARRRQEQAAGLHASDR